LCLGIGAPAACADVVLWKSMLSTVGRFAPRLAIAAVACSALVVVVMPSATAAPESDSQGYVDSTASCTSPDTAVAFGSTTTSRVAICKTSAGKYEYRGVRVRDGAKLILPATQSSSGAFVAENDGITYTLSASSLVVSAGSEVVRDEALVDYHGPSTAATGTTATTPSTTSVTPAAPDPPSTPVPKGPPLPAEVGGSGS
jgi:hypothetical protein